MNKGNVKMTNEIENNTVDTKDEKGQARKNNNLTIANHRSTWVTIPMEVPFIAPQAFFRVNHLVRLNNLFIRMFRGLQLHPIYVIRVLRKSSRRLVKQMKRKSVQQINAIYVEIVLLMAEFIIRTCENKRLLRDFVRTKSFQNAWWTAEKCLRQFLVLYSKGYDTKDENYVIGKIHIALAAFYFPEDTYRLL